MKIFVPAINDKEDVKYFEVQCLVKKSKYPEVKITGLIGDSIIDTVHVFTSILEFDILHLARNIKKEQIHFHFTDGSFIKEGTSVGLGIAFAYLANIKKAVQYEGNILVTGEIDLYGNVCEVGGVERKLEGHDFNFAVIPKANYRKEYGENVIGISNIMELIK